MRDGTLTFAGEPEPERFRFGVTTIGLWVPAAWMLAFWSLVLRARVVTGEWPHGRSGNFFDGTMVPETIDPRALGIQSDIVILTCLLAIWAVPIVLLILGVSIFEKRLRQPPWMIVVFLVSSLLTATTVFLDPGGFMVWVGD